MVAWLHCILMAMFVGLWSGHVFGQEVTPGLAEWLSSWKAQDGVFQGRLVFVERFPTKSRRDPQFLEFDVQDFNRLSFFSAIDARTASWNYRLNEARLADMDPRAAILVASGAELLVYTSKQGPWSIFRIDGAGKIKRVLSAVGPESTTASELVEWLPRVLGWDGIVLDVQGSSLLVGSTVSLLQAIDIQALAVQDSERKMVLRPVERRGAGLLSLTETRDGFGVFEVVFLGQGVRSLEVGTKLLLEKKGTRGSP